MARLLDSALPLVAAPMAGGPSTPALAAAVAGAGGFPFLAGGYLSPAAFAELLAEVRPVGEFGVNLFLPQDDRPDPAEFRRYAERLAPEAAALGVALDPVPVEDDDAWPTKLDLLLADPVPVVSTTFGLPDRAAVLALQRVGTRVLASVTTPAEAAAARELGVDGLVVQGVEAGGHSARFDPRAATPSRPFPDLVRAVRAGTGLPVIAGGGVTGPAAVRDLIAAGADAVAVGTLLLRCDESGASATHREALADPSFTETVITHCFTGRPARALRNAFVDRHHAAAPYGYPALHHLTRDLRRAAARAGDPHRLHLWAGTGFREARTGPAADVVRALAERL
ncbi:NAD(P)H-dependent flavin oxidoreductase [Microlunatus parietis]|uniref:Propionate 3-nitronate monooxygenase n=1 Tax=Microlunatus parietis TaxID=682979 RepID=A0A7Y9IEE7_9ACTN|nr:nitronate monooxygenase [Microlunatus parietis]NYE75416.1 NAD(P)H-dependent flavin oxidoreductase YrpB (nitropropane dioxygenase family) [Microlunatus parietis]